MQAISFALLLLAAVPSLQPYFAADDKALDPNIVGTWRNHDTIWRIEQTAGRADYTLTMGNGVEIMYTATLFRMGEATFLDLQPMAAEMIESEFLAGHIVAAHTLFRVWVRDDTLSVSPLDRTKLEVMLTQQPDAIPHAMIERHGVRSKLVLTATTNQLRAFAQKNLNTLFTQPMSLRRDLSAPLPPALLPGAANDELTTVSVPRGVSLNSAQAAMRAARYANDEAEKSFGARPFRPNDFIARLESDRWHWGNLETPVINGYSAEVTMTRSGFDADIKVKRMTEREEIRDNQVPEVPSAPIVPKY